MATDKLDQLFGVEEIKAQQAQVLGIIDDTVNRITEASKKMRINELFVSDSGGLSKSVDAIKAATAAINEQKEATDKLLAAKKQEQDLANTAANAGNAKIRKEDADAIQGITQAMAALSKERERMTALAAQEATNAQKLSSSYEQLKRQYADNADGAKKLAAAQVLAGNAMGSYSQQTQTAIANTQAIGEKLSSVEKNINSYESQITSCNGVSEQFNTWMGQLPLLASSSGDKVKELSGYMGSFASTIIKAREEGKSWTQTLGTLATSSDAITAAINLTVTAVGSLIDYMNDTSTEQKTLLLDTLDLRDGVDALTRSYRNLNNVIDNDEKLDIARIKAEGAVLEAQQKTETARVKIHNETEQKIIQSQKNAIEQRKANAQKEVHDLIEQQGYWQSQVNFARDNSSFTKDDLIKRKNQLDKVSDLLDKARDRSDTLNRQSELNDYKATEILAQQKENIERRSEIAYKRRAQERMNLLDQENDKHKKNTERQDKPEIKLKTPANSDNENEPKYIDDVDKLGEKELEEEKRIADLRKQVHDDFIKSKLKDEADANAKAVLDAENAVKLQRKVVAAMKSAEQDVFKIFDAINKRKDEQDDEQIKKIQDKQELDINAVNAGFDNQADKERQIAKIKIAADAEQKRLETEKKKRAQKFAAAEKAATITEIIGRTALAVVTTLSDKTIQPGYVRIPLAIAVGLSGAAQLATAMAAPLPQYARGTAYHPGGKFIAGDGGERELIVPNGKRPYWSNPFSTLYNEGAGTKVIPLGKLSDASYKLQPLPVLGAAKDSNMILANEIRSYTAALTSGSSANSNNVNYQLLHGLIQRTVKKGSYAHKDYLTDNS